MKCQDCNSITSDAITISGQHFCRSCVNNLPNETNRCFYCGKKNTQLNLIDGNRACFSCFARIHKEKIEWHEEMAMMAELLVTELRQTVREKDNELKDSQQLQGGYLRKINDLEEQIIMITKPLNR